ncbi:hypothetical protein ACJJTC_005606 [Scirpophaga incertulas]
MCATWILAPFMRQCSSNFILQCQFAKKISSGNVKPFQTVPGLKALPVIGVMHHFLPIVGSVGLHKNFFNMFDVLYEKYGPIVKIEGIFGRGPMVMFFKPEDYDKIYRAEEIPGPIRRGFQALEYYREVLRKETFDGIYGLTTAQGEKWRQFRTKVNPALLKPKLVKLYAPGLESIAKDLVTRLNRLDSRSDTSQELETYIRKWSLESVGLVALGDRIGCLEDNLPNDHPANSLMYCSKTIPDLSFQLEFLPSFWNKWNPWRLNKLMDLFDLQWDVSQMFINEAKKRIINRQHEIPDEEQSILEKLLAIDDKVAVMMANEMLFAGIDTVSYSAIGVLYHLATNQLSQEKVRQEIREGISSRYLKASIKESLRLLPVLSANLRETSRDHIVGGYHIPKGVFAIAPNEYLSKLEQNYPKAKEFIPERWLVNKSDPLYYGNTNAMITLPFGFGVRSCIGRRIAELELEILIKKLLEELSIEWTGPPINVITKVINEFKKPYYFRFNKI